MNKDLLLEMFIKAARKQRLGLKDGHFGHALICNYQSPTCERCNCGVADLQTALNIYEQKDAPVELPADLVELISVIHE